jgi:hypothetical protein
MARAQCIARVADVMVAAEAAVAVVVRAVAVAAAVVARVAVAAAVDVAAGAEARKWYRVAILVRSGATSLLA